MFSVIVVFLLSMFIWIGYTLLAGRENLQKGKIFLLYTSLEIIINCGIFNVLATPSPRVTET
jgi:hypothetical protein